MGVLTIEDEKQVGGRSNRSKEEELASRDWKKHVQTRIKRKERNKEEDGFLMEET